MDTFQAVRRLLPRSGFSVSLALNLYIMMKQYPQISPKNEGIKQDSLFLGFMGSLALLLSALLQGFLK